MSCHDFFRVLKYLNITEILNTKMIFGAFFVVLLELFIVWDWGYEFIMFDYSSMCFKQQELSLAVKNYFLSFQKELS